MRSEGVTQKNTTTTTPNSFPRLGLLDIIANHLCFCECGSVLGYENLRANNLYSAISAPNFYDFPFIAGSNIKMAMSRT